MSEEYIKRLVSARENKLRYSFLSNRDYAAKMQELSEVQDRLYRRAKIFTPSS